MALEFFSGLLTRRRKDNDFIENPSELPPEIVDTPLFKARNKNQEEYIIDSQSPSKDEEGWGLFSDGDYSQGQAMILDTEIDFSELFPEKNNITLRGNELILAAIIVDYLEEGRKIRVVDIGGMLGTSWSHLAIYFREFVEQGLIEFVVTNLRFSPENLLKKIKKNLEDPTNDYPGREVYCRNIIEGCRLVRFVQSSTETLTDVVGPSDIIFESHSATFHSATPGKERFQILSALKAGGLYISGNGLHPLAHERYKELAETTGLDQRLSEEEVNAARKTELAVTNTLIADNPQYTVSRYLNILNSDIKFRPSYFIAKKNKEEIL